LGSIAMVPDFNLGWQHAFNRFMANQGLTFAGTGESFTVSGVPLGTDAAAMQAGVNLILSPAATLDAGYDGTVSNRTQDHAVRAELSWKF